ncbi:MAG TPA: winged helix-turn-helix transcriptional regulator [Anaerolineales bacterium]|jgi:predicted transcriptional regulator|nr:winged helix-turn-helix transcriptional regulator [Anaerolineales bacterium]
MADIKQHEYSLLNEIAQNSMVTQAGLSEQLGIAVGSVNWYIKRLVRRGWVKVSHLDRTRLKYDLTAEGMKVFTKRAVLYMHDSLRVYATLREKAKVVVAELKQKQIAEVCIQGDSEAMDILRLTCIEMGVYPRTTPCNVVLRTNGNDYQVIIGQGLSKQQ